MSFPATAAGKVEALEHEITLIDTRLAGRDIATLVDLPVMHDARVRVVMSTLTDIWSAAFIVGDPTLARLFSATMVRLSLEHGNVEDSAYGYVTHAITVGPQRGDYARAHAFGRLALAVNQRFADRRRRAKIYQQFHAHVSPWCEPWADCLAYAKEACRAGLDSGDFLYGAYGAGTELWTAMLATQDLARFDSDHAHTVPLLEKLKNRGFADSVKLILNWGRALRGLTRGPLSLSDATFDEDNYLRSHHDNPFFATVHAVCRLHLCCLLGRPDEARAAARAAGATVHHLPGTVWPVTYGFWSAMAAVLGDEGDRGPTPAALIDACALFDLLATHCAANYRAQALILAAELARWQGRVDAALACYEQAIEGAAELGQHAFQALACERAAGLRRQRGQPRLAGMLLAQARQCYATWGAAAKVGALAGEQSERVSWSGQDAAHAALPAPQALAVPTAPPVGLDMVSLMKAAQAIAGEVELGRLLGRLLHIAIENAGAERACLVLEGSDGPMVYSSDVLVAGDADAVPEGTPLDETRSLPTGIVNFVRRTADSVVLADALHDDRHRSDAYIGRHRPRSVMCVPVQQLGRLVGVLYLENSVTADAFTAERTQVMQMLASEAASALDNARLVAGLKQEIAERAAAQQQLGTALTEVRRLQQDLEDENRQLRRDLIANVSHDLRTPLVSMRGFLEVLATKGDGLPADQRQSYLQIALRQSETLTTLVDELFELAKLDFNGVQLEPEAFPFHELVSDVLQKFQLSARSRRLDMHLEAGSKLPLVWADLRLMERVLDNLIGNAMQHTPDGGRIGVSVEVRGETLKVRVIDTGNGIAAGDLPHVFDRHYRGSRSAAAAGAGLGLAITQRILDLHGSAIGVTSTPNEGSCFEFSLPVARAARQAAAGAS